MSMTKHIHVTDLREVSALKLTCRKCGAAVTVALGALGSLHRCPVCQVDWPHNGAAILGDTVNYWIGKYAGDWILHRSKRRWIQKKYLDRTHEFFEKYGGKTIILARFVPIVRTFAPFVAGIGAMTYGKFIVYNVVGGVLWVGICVGAGYLFGGLPIVQNNFSLVVLGIVFVSILPGVIEFIRAKRNATRMVVPSAKPTLGSPMETRQ